MFATLFTILGLSALLAASFLWHAFVLTKLWAWFVVPMFGLPALPLVYAIGLWILVEYIKGIQDLPTTNEDEKLERFAHAAAKATLWPAATLFSGWVVTLFI